MKKVKRKEAVQLIIDYYKSINREKIPDLSLYSLHDLRKVLCMFNLKLNEN
jgi:hypothetical protein